jgi:hypothetical protein
MSSEINSYLVRERVDLPALATSGLVALATVSVDIVSHLGVSSTAANLVLTLPDPTITRNGRVELVTNIGANSFTMYNLIIAPNQFGYFVWGEGIWKSGGLPTTSAADFWRTVGTAATPDGITDVLEDIRRNGKVGIKIDPHSSLDISGSFSTRGLFIGASTTTTLNDTHHFIEVGNASPTFNLPLPASCPGREYKVQFTGNSGDNVITSNVITITTPAGSIYGWGQYLTNPPTILVKEGDIRGVTLKSDGSNWQVTGEIAQRFASTDLYAVPTTKGPVHSALGGINYATGLFTLVGGVVAGLDFNINPDVSIFTMIDGNYAATLVLPATPVATNNSLSIYCNSTFGVTIKNVNTDMPHDVSLEGGIVAARSMHFEWADNRWNWRPTPVLTGIVPVVASLQRNVELNGTAKISLAGEVSWSGRFITMSNGINPQEPAGYHDITMPAVGANITVANGTVRAVVAPLAGQTAQTGGIPLGAWETLWYKVPYGSGASSIPANFMIQPYAMNTKVFAPSNGDEWVMVCSRDDENKFKFGSGDVTSLGTQMGGGLALTNAVWDMMKRGGLGDGYFFTTFETTIPSKFGFTSGIRWIDGGSAARINNAGYVDVTQAGKTAGTVIYGVNGAANRAWLTPTAVDGLDKFGGITKSNSINFIDPLITTVCALNDNETLFYAPDVTIGGVNTGTWYVAGYAGIVPIPEHWLPVARRQATYGHSTMQILVGTSSANLRAGEAKYMGNDADSIDRLHRRMSLTHDGIKYCRATQAGFFTGTGANGATGSGAEGVLVSWDDNTLMYGIGDGYANWGNQYSWINVPVVGTAIPITTLNGATAITRVIEVISGRRYVPLAPYEKLWFIPPMHTPGTTSNPGDFVITDYAVNAYNVPSGAVLVAALHGGVNSGGVGKTRVKFADGTYIQPGFTFASATPALRVENDQAQGSGDWRAVTVAGQTGPGMTAPLTAVPGVVGPYPGNFTPFYKYEAIQDDTRGNIKLRGLIQLNAGVANNSTIAFVAGVGVIGSPAIAALVGGYTVVSDNAPTFAQLRFANVTVNGQVGIAISVLGGLNPANSPLMTLGVNGNAAVPGNPTWVSLDNIVLSHT